MQFPSASNSTGTLIGTLAGAAIATAAPSWPFIVSAAAALGMTPVGLAGVAGIGVTAFVNYAATHIAEVYNLNELLKEYWPQIQQSYPQQKDGSFPPSPVAQGQPNSNINQSG